MNAGLPLKSNSVHFHCFSSTALSGKIYVYFYLVLRLTASDNSHVRLAATSTNQKNI